jgi:hypothetical protein
MENEHVLSGMIKKRAELAGEIERAQTVFRQLVIDLDNLDAAIRLFDPDIDLTEIKPKPLPPRYAAFRGEVSRIVLNALREKGPLTTQQLAQFVMAHRGLNTADKRLVKTIGKRVDSTMRHQRSKGFVKVFRKPGQCAVWELANEAQ